MPVELYVDKYDFNEQYLTLDEAAANHDEGDDFELVQVTVRSMLTIKIIDGKPQLTAIAMPTIKGD